MASNANDYCPLQSKYILINRDAVDFFPLEKMAQSISIAIPD